MTDNNLTCIIASHNLREIDDICDSIVLMHKGELVTNTNTDQLKGKIHKVQMAFRETPDGDVFEGINVEVVSQVGSYYNLVAKGDIDEIMEALNGLNPAFIEVLPSTLEEVFINEMEEVGYGK